MAMRCFCRFLLLVFLSGTVGVTGATYAANASSASDSSASSNTASIVGGGRASANIPASQEEAIELARKELDAAGLDDAQKKEAQSLLDNASAFEKEASLLEQKLQELTEHATDQAPEMPAALTEAERQNQLKQWTERVPADASVNTLESLLAEEQNTYTELKARMDSVSDALNELISRPGRTLVQMAALRQKTQESADQTEQKPQDEPAALQTARRLLRLASSRQAALELAVHEAEQSTAEVRQRQLEVQLQTLRQEQLMRAPRIEWLTQRVASAGRLQLQKQMQNYAQKHEALLQTPEGKNNAALVALAEQNADIARQILDATDSLTQERQTLSSYERQKEQVGGILRDLQARLRLGGSNTAVGPLLWRQWQSIPSLLALDTQRSGIQAKATDLRLQLYNSTEERHALTLVSQSMQANTANEAEQSKQAEQLESFKNAKVALLDQLEPLLRRRIAVLEQTDESLYTLKTQGDELRTMMGQNLLWMPSHQPIGSKWFSEWRSHATEIGALTAVAWSGLRVLAVDVLARPVLYLLGALVLAGLLWLRMQAPKHLRLIHQQIEDIRQDNFLLTLKALGWSVIIALPHAVAVWALGSVLQEVGARYTEPIEVLGRVLVQFAVPLLFTGMLGTLTQPDGLGVAHLKWPPQMVQAVRRVWIAALAIMVPAVMFMSLLALQADKDTAISTQGRVAIMVVAVGLAVLSWNLLRSMATWNADNHHPLAIRALSWLLPAAFACMVFLPAAGYVFTSAIIVSTLLNSMIVVLVASIADGLLHRWLLISERRLTLKQLQNQQSSKKSTHAVVDAEAGDVLPDENRAMELVTVSAQSRRLLRLLHITMLLVGLALVWAGMLPALSFLDDIVLWHGATESVAGEAGKVAPVAVTLKNVLLSVVLFVLTSSVVRNLPGIVELLLTSSVRISVATRYTIATLVRYVVSLAGYLTALGLLGLRWGQLQWMAAALTVGLGFGLQEIFANFVSGLILLVERPFRVGDTVSINNLTGTITNIRTRATTVLDYDNKETIIPNKTFITGQITNWTLSDNITRLVLKIGVAYGSDTEKVRELLLQAAKEHYLVLTDPAASAWFTSMGDSSLNFDLRVYVANFGDRLRVGNDLNRRIIELFDAEGIEIPFPQMDLHVRDVPQNASSNQ